MPDPRLQLQPVDVSDPPPGAADPLDRITDSVARKLYERKQELGIDRDGFMLSDAEVVDRIFGRDDDE